MLSPTSQSPTSQLMLANTGMVPFHSYHHGSKYNARSSSRQGSRGGYHSRGPKHSRGLRGVRLPAWKTMDGDRHSRPDYVRGKWALNPDDVTWDQTAMALRQYKSGSDAKIKEGRWNASHAVVVSNANVDLPQGCRAYFGVHREFDTDGVVMPPLPSAVVKSQSDRSAFMRKTRSYQKRYELHRPNTALSGVVKPSLFQPRSSRSSRSSRPATAPE